MRLTQRSSNVRVSSGVPTLDEMCGGGFFKDSIILATGATGTRQNPAGQQVSGGWLQSRRTGDSVRLRRIPRPALPQCLLLGHRL